MNYIDADTLLEEIRRLHSEHSTKYDTDEAGLVLEKLEDFVLEQMKAE